MLLRFGLFVAVLGSKTQRGKIREGRNPNRIKTEAVFDPTELIVGNVEEENRE